MAETPQMMASNMAATSLDLSASDFSGIWRQDRTELERRIFGDPVVRPAVDYHHQSDAIDYQEEEDMATMRVVRVYIIDPDENVPIDKRLIYQGEEQFTDLTDQELFFEIDIKPPLETHNEFRKTLKTKGGKVADREPLEEIKIRDLRMTVVSLAEF